MSHPFGDLPLAGLRIGVDVRQSHGKNVGNWSTRELDERLTAKIAQWGGTPVPYNENEGVLTRRGTPKGVSGRDLTKRKVALRMLDDVESGDLQGIAAYDIKRLTRDEFGADGSTIAKRLNAARGILVTIDKVYRPWVEEDLKAFDVEKMVSAWDVRGIRSTMFRGIFSRARYEAFFRGAPPLGYSTDATIIRRAGVEVIYRTPIKHPGEADLMADLMRWLDEAHSAGMVVRRMTGKWGAYLRERGRERNGGDAWAGAWSTTRLYKILENPLYRGRWEFGRRADKKNPVWDIDDRRARVAEFTHDVPDLGYWTEAQARAWLAKFRTGTPRRGRSKHEHLLLGILACPGCHEAMTGYGAYGYVCPRYNLKTCPGPEMLTEKSAWKALREHLPEWLAEAEEAIRREALAKRTARRSGGAALAEAERDLRAVQESLAATLEAVGASASPTVKARIEELTGREAAALARVERERRLLEDAEEVREAFAHDLVEIFDRAFTPEKRAAVYRQLVDGVEFRGEGHVRTRRHALVGYRNLFTQGSDPAPTSRARYLSSLRAAA